MHKTPASSSWTGLKFEEIYGNIVPVIYIKNKDWKKPSLTSWPRWFILSHSSNNKQNEEGSSAAANDVNDISRAAMMDGAPAPPRRCECATAQLHPLSSEEEEEEETRSAWQWQGSRQREGGGGRRGSGGLPGWTLKPTLMSVEAGEDRREEEEEEEGRKRGTCPHHASGGCFTNPCLFSSSKTSKEDWGAANML